ncbi:MAG: DUF5982 domain-containing protein [Leptospira sp.]|nr:DUF5982 domain-containing protein [Leptospira sp.]
MFTKFYASLGLVFLYLLLGINSISAQNQNRPTNQKPTVPSKELKPLETPGEKGELQKTSEDDENIPLPFEINSSKRLTDYDIKRKKTGSFFTGLPLLNSDPNNGIGYGVRVFYFQNNDKKDPFFEYTPYRYRVFAQYFRTTLNAQNHWLSFDAPYIFDTKWRVRADLLYERNPNFLFFGVGESSLQPLAYHQRNDETRPLVQNGTFNDYMEAGLYKRPGDAGQAPFVSDAKYNRYEMENPNANLSAEKSLFGGTVRLVAGTRLSKQIIRTFDGKSTVAKDPIFGDQFLPDALNTVPYGTTLLTEEAQAGRIRGINGGYVNTVRAGVVYDTRDFEPDPNSGLFFEATHERSMRAIGSQFEFNRNLASGRFFYSPAPGTFKKLVIAGRATVVQTNGDVPFYEYRNMWGTEGNQVGLGGRTTLRGYKQDRFLGPVMGFGNLEIRWKFGSVATKTSTFDFQLVPFVDFGRVWDGAERMNLKGYKYSYGLGFRIPWNQSTIIYFDYAISREDRQLFVNFQHIF